MRSTRERRDKCSFGRGTVMRVNYPRVSKFPEYKKRETRDGTALVARDLPSQKKHKFPARYYDRMTQRKKTRYRVNPSANFQQISNRKEIYNKLAVGPLDSNNSRRPQLRRHKHNLDNLPATNHLTNHLPLALDFLLPIDRKRVV